MNCKCYKKRKTKLNKIEKEEKIMNGEIKIKINIYVNVVILKVHIYHDIKHCKANKHINNSNLLSI